LCCLSVRLIGIRRRRQSVAHSTAGIHTVILVTTYYLDYLSFCNSTCRACRTYTSVTWGRGGPRQRKNVERALSRSSGSSPSNNNYMEFEIGHLAPSHHKDIAMSQSSLSSLSPLPGFRSKEWYKSQRWKLVYNSHEKKVKELEAGTRPSRSMKRET
jgi:hypothetical protein